MLPVLLRVEDLLVELAGAEVVVALLLGVELGHAEQAGPASPDRSSLVLSIRRCRTLICCR